MAEEPLEADLLNSVDGGSQTPEVAAVHASDPGACDACLPPSAGQVPSSSFPVSVDTDPVQMASYSAWKRAHVVARKKREAEHAQAREALIAVWSVIEESSKGRPRAADQEQGGADTENLAPPLVQHAVGCWHGVCAVDTIVTVDDVLIGSPMGTADGKVSLQEVEDWGEVPEVEGLQNQSRYASTSNPGQGGGPVAICRGVGGR
ncbi:hypothetical protein B0H10DRAFT_1940336 [Mycena sp. CBHHK59/15]|nr:hypothetical protein B0H10DRAFT_1940336 [Mycena sp. CBHHK59/15]